MVLSNGTNKKKKKKWINTKNSGLRHVSTKPSAQRRSDQNMQNSGQQPRAAHALRSDQDTSKMPNKGIYQADKWTWNKGWAAYS